MAERRPRFERNRGKPYKDPYGEMRQANWPGSFQTIDRGLRRVSQLSGWSRSYEDGTQRVPIDRTHTDKSFT